MIGHLFLGYRASQGLLPSSPSWLWWSPCSLLRLATAQISCYSSNAVEHQVLLSLHDMILRWRYYDADRVSARSASSSPLKDLCRRREMTSGVWSGSTTVVLLWCWPSVWKREDSSVTSTGQAITNRSSTVICRSQLLTWTSAAIVGPSESLRSQR